jgi:hypothetical protein
MAYERKRPRSVRLTEKEILRNIRQIDKSRSRTREILTGKRHGDSSMFDLTLNASGWEIKRLAFAAADFAARWFEMQDETAGAGMDRADAAADGMDAT